MTMQSCCLGGARAAIQKEVFLPFLSGLTSRSCLFDGRFAFKKDCVFTTPTFTSLGHGLPQEAILFLQRLASLARMGWTRGPLQATWESTFLDMVHTLCTSHNLPQVRPLRITV